MKDDDLRDLDYLESFLRRHAESEEEAEALCRIFNIDKVREILNTEEVEEESEPGTHDNPVPEDYDEAYESALASYEFYMSMLEEEEPPIPIEDIISAITQAEETINTLRRLKNA